MNTLIHEEKYRGQAILNKMASQHFTVCGAGAIGSNMVDNMARQGFKSMSVIDMDRVEDHNRHTQVWDRRDMGLLKVTALKNRIFNSAGITIEDISKKLEESNIKRFLKKDSIVIDGFDNSASRRLVTEYCRSNKITCLHVGLYKDCAEVTWNDVYRIPSDVQGLDVCEYPLARNIILLAVTVATEVLIRYLEKGSQESYTITLGDFKITG